MEAVMELLSAIPTWGWVVLGIAALFMLGDRVLWDYEVKFPMQAGVGRGKVELECLKRRGTVVEGWFELEPASQGQAIDIAVAGQHLLTLGAEKTTGRRVRFSERVEFSRPREGDLVTISMEGRERLSGPLVLD